MNHLDNLQTVSNNYQLDNALIGSSAQHACIVHVNDWLGGQPLSAGGKQYPTFTKPIGARLAYISKQYIPAGITESHTFEKKKGYTAGFTLSHEIKSSVGANIMGCDLSLEVTTSYSYSMSIMEETTESWTHTVQGPNDYFVYQPVLIYCTRVASNSHTQGALEATNTHYVKKTDELFFLAPVYRNNPQTINHGVDPVNPSAFDKHLLHDAWDSWYTDLVVRGKGHLLHIGSGRYVVAKDSTGEGKNGNPLVLWDSHGSQTPSGNEFNKFVLLQSGHLYHQGYGKYVVAKDSTGSGGNGNPLVLWDSYGSQAPSKDEFNKFALVSGGHLYHHGTGRYVVAENSTGSGGNGNRLVLWSGYGSQTPMGDAFNAFRFLEK